MSPVHEHTAKRFRHRITLRLIWYVLIGVAIMAGTYFYFQNLSQWELTGGSRKMYRMEVALYELGGKWLPSGILFALGVALVLAGIRDYRKDKRLLEGRLTAKDPATAPSKMSSMEARTLLEEQINKQSKVVVTMLKWLIPLVLATLIILYLTAAEQLVWVFAGLCFCIYLGAVIAFWWRAQKTARLMPYIKQHPEKVVWVYMRHINLNGAPSQSLMIGDNKGALRFIPVNPKKPEEGEQLMQAAAQVFDKAVLGYSSDFMKKYRRDPYRFNK